MLSIKYDVGSAPYSKTKRFMGLLQHPCPLYRPLEGTR